MKNYQCSKHFFDGFFLAFFFFWIQNSFISYDVLHKLSISQPKQYLQVDYGILLLLISSYCMHNTFLLFKGLIQVQIYDLVLDLVQVS